MCNLYSITTNQAAIIALFRVMNRYVGNLAPMPRVFPDYPAPVIRNTDSGTELTMNAIGACCSGATSAAVLVSDAAKGYGDGWSITLPLPPADEPGSHAVSVLLWLSAL